MHEPETERASRRRRARVGITAAVSALIAVLAFTATAGATTFAYSSSFGATGIANTLDQPSYTAIDPVNHYIYVSNYDYQVTNTVERFNLDGTPAPFTTASGDVNSNVLGVADVNQDKAVFRGTNPGSFDCGNQAYNSGNTYQPNGIRCFSQPQGIAVDPSGNVYVSNSGAPTVDIFDKTGSWIGEIGPYFDGTHQNGYGLTNFLGDPTGLAYDTTSNLLFIANSDGNIWVFHGTGAVNPTFTYVGKLGSTNGSAANQFYYPAGLATDNSGNLYIADSGNDRIDHWTYSLSGNSVIASPAGSWNPTGSDAEPQGITYTPGDGNQTPASIFVTDEYAYDVEQFSPAGTQLATFGGYGGAVGEFEDPFGIAALANDGTHGTNLYIVDQDENQVEDFIPSPPPVNTAAPVISGTAQVGQTLTSTTGTWSNVNSASTYTYNWMQCNAAGANCFSIQNGAASTLPLTSGLNGQTVKVGVYANNGQQGQEALSALTAVIGSGTPVPISAPAPAPTPVATPAPVVTPSAANTKVTSLPSSTTSTKALSATGQAVTVKIVSGTTVTLQLILDKKTAKQVHLGSGKSAVVVGSVTVKNVKGTTATIKAILTKKARAALSKLHRTFELTLRTTFTLNGHSYTINRVETINRPKVKKKKKK